MMCLPLKHCRINLFTLLKHKSMGERVVPKRNSADGENFGQEVVQTPPIKKGGERDIENKRSTIDECKLEGLPSVAPLTILECKMFIRDEDKHHRQYCRKNEGNVWIEKEYFHKNRE